MDEKVALVWRMAWLLEAEEKVALVWAEPAWAEADEEVALVWAEPAWACSPTLATTDLCSQVGTPVAE